jgi:hypothetical protein
MYTAHSSTLQLRVDLDCYTSQAWAQEFVFGFSFISLSFCSLCLAGEEGACALAEALASNPSIREINLHGNSIGDAGVTAICTALQASGAAKGAHLDAASCENCNQ